MDFGAIVSGLDAISTGARVLYHLARLPERQRALAGTRLRLVVDEITHSFDAIESQLVRLLQVDLTPAGVANGRGVLVELEGGNATIRLAEMRGHCTIIGRIWDEELKNPFQKLFASDFQQIEAAFGQLGTVDSVMLRVADVLAEFLADEASAVLDLVDDNKAEEAQLRIKAARADVRGLRRKVNRTLAEMVELRFLLEPGSSAPKS
jgi:hypothetical protein